MPAESCKQFISDYKKHLADFFVAKGSKNLFPRHEMFMHFIKYRYFIEGDAVYFVYCSRCG